jgi:membrane-bound lytic murein transglycosylase D
MNTHISLLLPVVMIVSLVGCNTLATKPSSGREKLSQQQVLEDVADNNSTQNSLSADSTYRIETEPTALALAFLDKAFPPEQSSNLFATQWSVENKQQQNPMKKVSPTSHLIQRSPQTLPEQILQMSSTIQLNTTPTATSQSNKHQQNIFATESKQPTTQRVINSFAPVKSQTTPTGKKLTWVKPLNSNQDFKQSSQSNRLTVHKPSSLKQRSEIPSRQVPQKKKVLASITNNKHQKNRFTSVTNRDLWDRVRQGYQFPPIEHANIQRFVDKYTQYPSYFNRISTKARPYLYHIVQELEKRGMPLELALLPAIESAYEPMALSHKSAAGLWQFVSSTADDYGLKQNIWYDARRDIMASTSAALNYLQQLYKTFDQDWLLALAAYNYGQGNLRKVMNKNLEQEKPTDFWSLELPTETREYVPKLFALAQIVARPEEYGIKLSAIADQPYLQKVKIDYPIDLSLAANLAGLSPSEFKRLNAAFRREAPDPEGPYHLTLPAHIAESFKQRLAKLPIEQRLFTYIDTKPENILVAISPSQVSEPPLLASVNTTLQQHQVNNGENLWSIAKQYNTTVAQLRELNDLKVEQALYVGKRLKVPTNVLPSQPTIIANNNSESQEETQQHRVQEGETLWNIAKRYQTTVAVLRKLNELKDNSVMVGKSLIVPTTIATFQKSVKSIQSF